MDWAYIAGYFDADGSLCIQVTREGSTITGIFPIIIFTGLIQTLEVIKAFLETERIIGNKFIITNHAHGGTVANFRVNRQEAVELFCKKVYPSLVEKRRHVEIAIEVLDLKKKLRSEGKELYRRENLSYFETFRKELHSHAKKGLKTLKPLVLVGLKG